MNVTRSSHFLLVVSLSGSLSGSGAAGGQGVGVGAVQLVRPCPETAMETAAAASAGSPSCVPGMAWCAVVISRIVS
jgi:hypothetical protein